MSVILDALKKAQDERKRPAYRGSGADETPPKRSKWVFYVIIGAVGCAILLVLFLPDIFRMQPPTRPQVAQQNQPPPPPPAASSVPAPQLPVTKLPEAPGKAPFPKLAAAPIEEVPRPGMATEVSPERKARTRPPEPEVRMAKDEVRTNLKAEPGSEARADTKTEPKRRPEAEPAKAASKQEKVEETKAAAAVPGPESTVVVKKMADDRIVTNYNNAIRAAEQGNREEAKRLYVAVLADQPDNIEALNNLGVLAMSEGNMKEATSYFRRILEHRKDYAKAYNNLGIIAMRDGDRKIAEEYFRKAIEVAPDGVEPYLNLAALLRADKRLEEANRVIDAPLRRGLRGAQLYLSAALIKDELTQYDEAIRYYRNYLQVSSQKDDRRRVIERLAFLEEHKSAESH